MAARRQATTHGAGDPSHADAPAYIDDPICQRYPAGVDAAALIRTARRRHGLTQAELAGRIGTSQPVISAYEHGRRDPSTETLRRIVAGAGERLELQLTRATSDLPPLTSLDDHARALVDVLLLADAIGVTRPPSTICPFPRIDSTGGST